MLLFIGLPFSVQSKHNERTLHFSLHIKYKKNGIECSKNISLSAFFFVRQRRWMFISHLLHIFAVRLLTAIYKYLSLLLNK